MPYLFLFFKYPLLFSLCFCLIYSYHPKILSTLSLILLPMSLLQFPSLCTLFSFLFTLQCPGSCHAWSWSTLQLLLLLLLFVSQGLHLIQLALLLSDLGGQLRHLHVHAHVHAYAHVCTCTCTCMGEMIKTEHAHYTPINLEIWGLEKFEVIPNHKNKNAKTLSTMQN